MAIGLEFYSSCVNCNGKNYDYRNEEGLPCFQCLPEDNVHDVYTALKERGTLKNYRKIRNFQKKCEDFENFFKVSTGFLPTGFQKFWMRRVLLNRSFTIVAPTGTGKTTFGVVCTSWFTKNNKKVLVVLPTVVLVKQFKERLDGMGVVNSIAYHSGLSKKEREEISEKIKKGDFNSLVISTQFLSRNFHLLENTKFDFIFVDDVDAVLKASKNIERLLLLLGFSQEDIENAYKKITGKLKDFVKPEKYGVLVVSSATAKPRGLKPLLFRELLDFDIGTLTLSSRNVLNVQLKEKNFNKLLDAILFFKDGIFVFATNADEAKEIVEFLKERGINAEGVVDGSDVLERFASGELNILVGVSSYYGKLVRGVDLPERVKFVVFYGVPHFRYSVDKEKAPRFVIKKILRYLSKSKKDLIKFLNRVDYVKDLDLFRKELPVNDDDWKEAVSEVFKDFPMEGCFVKFPDVLTYIQASGRASRYKDGILTRGISVVLEEDERLFNLLKERIEWLTEEEWIDWNDVNWKEEFKKIEETRSKRSMEKMEFGSTLFVVESPTKASTLSGFFGRSGRRKYKGIVVYESVVNNRIFLFTASRGHVYDLVTGEGFHGVRVEKESFLPIYSPIKRCRNCGYQFTDGEVCPKCGSSDVDDKGDVLEGLRDLSLEVDEILIATDPDTEGEKISYDIYQYLKPVNDNVKRVELHEITRHEFSKGVNNPRKENEDLVKAQVVRRVQDRWVGFELSKKVQKYFKKVNLSAGRVQSTVLGWIVQREEEYKNSAKVFTSFYIKDRRLEIEGDFKGVEKVDVKVMDEHEEELNPPPPFTTDAILSEASSRFKMKVSDVMGILQELFEKGFITYHRTDSTRISSTGISLARRLMEKMGISEIFQPRSWSVSEGAHEAIRPVKAVSPSEIEDMLEEGLIKDITRKHVRVYELIYKRFLASQSRSVKVKKQKVRLNLNGFYFEDETISEILIDGWNFFINVDVFKYETSSYEIKDIKVYEKHTVPLFTQATLIEKMRNEGVGRPSTYAKIVDVLFSRGYIKEDKYQRIWPTPLGKKVYNFLKKNFPEFVTTETTKNLEEIMDKVERREEDYTEVLKRIYTDALRIHKSHS